MYSVLLIDDETWVLEDLKTLINWEENGFYIMGEANDAEEAKAKIDELKPDVVISDIRMPGLSGIQLLELYSQQGRQFKTVFVTAYGKFEYAKRALELGADGYLLKPVESNELVATLNKIKKELDSIGNTEYGDVLWVKTGALHILLDGYATQEERKRACEQLDLFKTETTFVVAVADVCSTALSDLQNVAAFDVRIIPMSDRHSVLFFQSKSGLFNVITYKNLIKIIHDFCEKNSVLVGLSRVFESQNKVHIAFGQAEQALNKSFINQKRFNVFGGKKANMTNINGLFLKYKNETPKSELLDSLLRVIHTEMPDIESLKNIFSQLYAQMKLSGEYIDADIKEIMLHFENIDSYFMYLKESLGAAGKKNGKTSSSNVVKEITEYIHANYNRKIMINDLAQQFFLNPSYLSNLFKIETGKSFTAFLVECRLNKAAELLEKSDLTLYEISARVGYEDYFHFSKLFKKHMNVSPAYYRKSKNANKA